MNRFNDIIAENKVVQIPGFFKSMWDYGDIIEKVFVLTDGLLSFDDFNIQKDDRHFKITVLSKNTETQFKLNRFENKKIDKKNLIKGLNRTLTDIFYLGDERFYDVSGEVVLSGIGFISNKQKRHLLKAGLIGSSKIDSNIEKNFKKTANKKNEIRNLTYIKKNRHYIKIKDSSLKQKPSLDKLVMLRYLKLKLENKSSLDLFNIIHHPEENKPETVFAAKLIAKQKNIPVFNKKDYEKLLEIYSEIIDKIVSLSKKKTKPGDLHRILHENDLDKNSKLLILSEVQRRIKGEKIDFDWGKVIKIILIIIVVVFILFNALHKK